MSIVFEDKTDLLAQGIQEAVTRHLHDVCAVNPVGKHGDGSGYGFGLGFGGGRYYVTVTLVSDVAKRPTKAHKYIVATDKAGKLPKESLKDWCCGSFGQSGQCEDCK